MLRVNFLVFFLIFVSLRILATEKIKIKHANQLSFKRLNNKKVRKLIGEVIFEHQNTLMLCDSAYFFEKDNNITAYGHIVINYKDSLSIKGEELDYFGNEKNAKIKGEKVTLTSEKFILTTTEIQYNMELGEASYNKKGYLLSFEDSINVESNSGRFIKSDSKIIFISQVKLSHNQLNMNTDTMSYFLDKQQLIFSSPSEIITHKKDSIYSCSGEYNTNSKIFSLFDKSEINSGKYFITGDTLFFNDSTQQSIFKSNAQILDTASNKNIQADYIYLNQKKDSFFVTNHPIITIYKNHIPIYIRADTIHSFYEVIKKDTVKMLLMYHNFELYKQDIQAIADSVVLFQKDSLIVLFNNPVVWSKNGQNTADTVFVKIKNNKIDTIRFIQNVFSIQKTDTINEFYNQIVGRSMYLSFDTIGIRNMMMNKNVSVIYYLKDEYGKYHGVNRVDGSQLIMNFGKKGLEKIKILNPFNSKIISLKQKNIFQQRFKGFVWMSEKQPKAPFQVVKIDK